MRTSKFPTVACGICGSAALRLGTKRCDRCWELETRIHLDPDIARRILDRVERKEAIHS